MREYKVISDFSTEHLESTIRSMLSEGWQLVGGISVIIYNNNADGVQYKDSDTLLYLQAIAR